MPFKKDGSRKAMMSHKPDLYKPKKHKGPYMMKPGSKEVDSPGIFKANEPAMMFKNNMPKQAKPDFPDVDKDGDRKEPITKAVKDLQSKKAMMYHDKPKMYGKPKMAYGKKPKMDHK
tara:strand:- start:169 stop:519 length:351 start_codon:yes stop_codon:yes gene_type:complete